MFAVIIKRDGDGDDDNNEGSGEFAVDLMLPLLMMKCWQ
jgi:hypothetical protein